MLLHCYFTYVSFIQVTEFLIVGKIALFAEPPWLQLRVGRNQGAFVVNNSSNTTFGFILSQYQITDVDHIDQQCEQGNGNNNHSH